MVCNEADRRRHVTPLPFFLFLYLSQRNMPHACRFAPEFERVTRLPAIAGDNRGHGMMLKNRSRRHHTEPCSD